MKQSNAVTWSLKYETALKADKFVLLVHGTAEEAQNAQQLLAKTSPATMAVHAG